jgi:hypothetical protein
MCNDDSPLAVFNLTGTHGIPQGADWDVAIRYKENNIIVDFSTATAVMQIRKDYDREIILELSTADGTISLSDGSGDTPNVVLHFVSETTSAMTSYEGIYDLEVTLSDGTIKKFLEGQFELRRQVTK